MTKLLREALDGVFHLADEVLELFDLLVSQLLLGNFSSAGVPFLLDLILQARDLVPEPLVLSVLPVELALDDTLRITL